MTLAYWSTYYGISVRPFVPRDNYTGRVVGNSDAMLIYQPDTEIEAGSPSLVGWDLHHLSDYVVMGVSGGTIWLAPRTTPLPERITP